MNRASSLAMCPFIAVALVSVLAASSAHADDSKPTREAFLKEVLDAKPTPVTPKFDDYTKGSYHIEKEDLLKGLTEEAKKQKLTLRAVTIIGPMVGDPLWTSYVAVLFEDGKKVRVNSLVMPHARITGKSTGLLTFEQYDKWLKAVHDTGTLKEAKNAPTGKGKRDASSPFASPILLVTWSKDGKARQVFHEKEDAKLEKLFDQYNRIMKDLKKTYPAKDK